MGGGVGLGEPKILESWILLRFFPDFLRINLCDEIKQERSGKVRPGKGPFRY